MPEINPEKIEEVLSKGVEKILPRKKDLKEVMMERKIKLYLGIDPTTPHLHLGHTVPLRKLKEFQELGHQAVLLFGSFTAQVGDPSERKTKRKPLTSKQVERNMAGYKKQAAKILDISKTEVECNSDWLVKLSFKEVLGLASRFTVSQLLERDMFQRRLQKKEEVWMNELLYPLMQGYDSVALNVDLELGATDQTFNMLVGRKLQRLYNKKEKFILTTPMLVGLDGEKMSKTRGNVINLDDKPSEMYGKIMSLKDELIIHYFELCTGLSLKKIKEIKKGLTSSSLNPREAKANLAREIVKTYYGKKKAEKAEIEFNRIFQEGGIPFDVEEVKISKKKLDILELLLKTGKVKSKSRAKNLILQKAVRINGVLKRDWRETVKIKKGAVIKIGKKRFVRIV